MQLKAWIDSQERFKSVSDAARELEVSPQHLHYILKGERNPSWNLIRKIVEVSGCAVTAEELMPGGRSTPDPDVNTGPMPRPATPLPSPALIVEDDEPVRLCVDIPRGLMEELRNVVWWSGGDVTLTTMVRDAIEARLAAYRQLSVQLAHPHSGAPVPKRAGQPYPIREGAVRRGRPLP